jgi:hypothetical protein
MRNLLRGKRNGTRENTGTGERWMRRAAAAARRHSCRAEGGRACGRRTAAADALVEARQRAVDGG